MKKGFIFAVFGISLAVVLISRFNSNSSIPTAEAQSANPTSQTKSPGTTVNTPMGPNSGGYTQANWPQPDNVKENDGRATQAYIYFSSPTCNINQRCSNGLKTTNYGFSLPEDATITGVVVEIESSASSIPGPKHETIRLLDASGNPIGDNKGGGNVPYGSTTYQQFGSTSDKWGTTLTPSEVNDADFGVLYQGSTGGSNNYTGNIDHIQITIHYTTPAPTLSPSPSPTATLTPSPSPTNAPLACDPDPTGSSANELDMDDYEVWKSEYSSGSGNASACLNAAGDTTVDLLDFQAWKDEYFFGDQTVTTQ